MSRKKLICLEVILIFASVLIFRSLWTLMDRLPLMNNTFILFISLFMGIIATILAFHEILKKSKNKPIH